MNFLEIKNMYIHYPDAYANDIKQITINNEFLNLSGQIFGSNNS